MGGHFTSSELTFSQGSASSPPSSSRARIGRIVDATRPAARIGLYTLPAHIVVVVATSSYAIMRLQFWAEGKAGLEK